LRTLRTVTGGPAQLLGLVLLLLLVVVPTTYQALKALLLAVVLALVVARELGRDRIGVARPVLHRALFFSALGGALVLVGLLRGTPGALALAPVYVLWPLVYTTLIAGVSSAAAVRRVLATLVVAALVIEVYALSFVAYSAGMLPSALYLPLDQGQAIGFYGGYIEFNLYSITSLVFLVPYLIGLLVVTPRDRPVPCGRPAVLVAVLLGLLVVLLSGRRALILVVAASPLLALTLRRGMPDVDGALTARQLLRGASLAVLVAFSTLSLTLGLSLGRLRLALSDAFDFSGAESQSRGPAQLRALLVGWADEPFFGAGLGAVAPGLIRSLEQPWAYELTYVALLFQVGVVGLVIYAYGGWWIFTRTRRVVLGGGSLAAPAAAVLTGFVCFLAANGTNPYLQKFDSLWVLFLPLALVNARLYAEADERPVPLPQEASTG
jgi:hypothetical protein